MKRLMLVLALVGSIGFGMASIGSAQIRAGLVNLATMVTGTLPGANGGTGIVNTGKTITIGGNLVTTPANAVTLTTTGATNVTLPTAGTLATLAGAEAFTNKTGLISQWTNDTAFLTSAAPTDATYITQTSNGSLSAEQALSILSTGIVRVATTTGALTSLTDSAGIFANISDETGSGVLVGATSPTLVTPVLGVATFTTLASTSTAAPIINLTPNSSSTVKLWSYLNNGAGGVYGEFRRNGGVTGYIGAEPAAGGAVMTGSLANAFVLTTNNFPIQIGTNDTPRVTFFAAGNVAVGTATDGGEAKLQVAGLNSSYAAVIRGTKYTLSGCSAGTTLGGASGGTFVSGTTGACTVVLTMGGSIAAPAGWLCSASNQTTPANIIQQSASSTTTCTITGTTVSGDVISWHAHGF